MHIEQKDRFKHMPVIMLNINGEKSRKISDRLHQFKFRSNVEITRKMQFQQKPTNDTAI